MIAAGLEFGNGLRIQRHAAFDFAHTHHAVIIDMGMHFDTFGNRAASAEQKVLFGFVVVDFHERSAHFHTFNGGTRPTVFNMNARR